MRIRRPRAGRVGRAQLGADRQQLVDAVAAGVPGADGREAVVARASARGRDQRERRTGPGHLLTVARRTACRRVVNRPSTSSHGAETSGNSAGQRLEHADGRDARQRADVGTPRHVHRHREAREDFRHPMVRQPAAVGDAGDARARAGRARDSGRRRPGPRGRGGAPARGRSRRARRCARRRPSCRPRRGRPPPLTFDRTAQSHVGGLVPGPGAARPAASRYSSRTTSPNASMPSNASSSNACISGAPRRSGGACRGTAGGTRRRGAVPTNPRHELGRVPLVDDDHVGALERTIEIEARQIVGGRAEPRERRWNSRNGSLAVIRQEMAPAPAVRRLVQRDLVPARHQLAHDAAQEMGVAVVPVRHERVVEEDELHADRFLGRERPDRAGVRGDHLRVGILISRRSCARQRRSQRVCAPVGRRSRAARRRQ